MRQIIESFTDQRAFHFVSNPFRTEHDIQIPNTKLNIMAEPDISSIN